MLKIKLSELNIGDCIYNKNKSITLIVTEIKAETIITLKYLRGNLCLFKSMLNRRNEISINMNIIDFWELTVFKIKEEAENLFKE